MNQKWNKSKVIWIETARINTRTTIISCPFPFKSIKEKTLKNKITKSSGSRQPRALPISFVSLFKLILARDSFLKRDDIQNQQKEGAQWPGGSVTLPGDLTGLMEIISVCRSQLKVKHLWATLLRYTNQKVRTKGCVRMGFFKLCYFILNTHRANIFPASMTTFFHQFQKNE